MAESSSRMSMEERKRDSLRDVEIFLKSRDGGANKGVNLKMICSSSQLPLDDAVHRMLRLHDYGLSDKDVEAFQIPQSTKCWCWNCCHPFDTVPLSVAHSKSDSSNQWMVYGVFCSVQCGVAHIHSETNDVHSRGTRVAMFATLCTKVYGLNASDVAKAVKYPAGPRFVLDAFGGPFSIEKYRADFQFVRTRILTDPLIPYHRVISQYSRHSSAAPEEGGAVDFAGVVGGAGAAVHGLRRPQVPTAAHVSSSNGEVSEATVGLLSNFLAEKASSGEFVNSGGSAIVGSKRVKVRAKKPDAKVLTGSTEARVAPTSTLARFIRPTK